MSKGKREQNVEGESQVNTRQDRNMFITDGGTWTWNAGTGVLAWSATARIWRGGVAVATIAAGSAVALSVAGDIAYVDIDRSAGGALTVMTGIVIASPTNRADARVVIGVRGSDAKFYMRDGTIFGDGDSKTLGTLNSTTDRGDIAATGTATDTVPFTYVVGSNQLAVYVGGALMEETLHYTEASPTTVTWTALGQPLAGERVSFVNIIGGQGPAGGTGSLQDAYDNGPTADIAGGSVARFYNTVGGATFGVDDAATGTPNFQVNSSGTVILNPGNAGLFLRDSGGTAFWALLPLDDGGTGDAIFYNTVSGSGFRVDKTTGGIEFGSYAGAFPGGTWTPDSAGELKWAVYTGAIDAGGADEVIATGLSNIVGLALSVDDGNRGGTNALDMGNGTTANKRIAAFFDAGTGTVTFSGDLAQSVLIGSHLRSEAYTLIVFYQG